MRRALLPALIGLGAGLVFVALVPSDNPTADTPVSVLSADQVVLLLPIDPSVERIVTDMRTELETVGAGSTDPRITRALDRAAGDDELLYQIAASPADRFSSGEAVATATPIFDISLGKERVVVTAITVELVPGYGATAGSRDHEDGHALINEKIAKRCARDALQLGIERGYRGQSLANFMVSSLYDATDAVHSKYHGLVRYARYGQHIAFAEQALDEVPGCGFSSTATL